MSGPTGGSRAILRLAWRDAARSPVRSALVIVLIALPVLGVVAATVVLNTVNVASDEVLERRLGAADALVIAEASPVVQVFDPEPFGYTQIGGPIRPLTPEGIARSLRRGAGDLEALETRRSFVQLRSDRGAVDVEVAELDLTHPLAEGLFRLTDGRWPEAGEELVVNAALADRGFAIGDRVEVLDGTRVRVVGVAESTARRADLIAAGPLGVTGVVGEDQAGASGSRWLVGGGPVSWQDVLALNKAGGVVVSRRVLTDPPPDSALPGPARDLVEQADSAVLAVTVLVAVMVLIEVVLLAGPAFAVGARRQARSLALMSAAGGTARQSQAVVLGSALVLGGLAVAGGAVGGIGAAWAALPLVQARIGTWLGPFEVVGWQVALVAGCGLLSALLAAGVPARIAAHADVVAVLAGRRGQTRVGMVSPLLGLIVMGAAVAGAAWGSATGGRAGVYAIAGAAIASVLGMTMLVPVVVAGVGRAARRLPLPLRYAARDAARHRTRTVPAVAAVAATVAGVVALGIANASSVAEAEATYEPRLAHGHGLVDAPGADARTWSRLAALVAEQTHREPEPILGIDGWYDAEPAVPDFRWPKGVDDPWTGVEMPGRASLVGDSVPGVLAGLDDGARAAAEDALAEGRVVLFAEAPADPARVRVVVHRQDERRTRTEVDATFVPFRGMRAPATSLIPPSVAEDLGLEPRRVGLVVDGGLTPEEAERIDEAVAGLHDGASFYVERGFQRSDLELAAYWILGILGGVLMLGGTLSATFLALSDARADLATLSAVGAEPRTRRAVAASYALMVGLTGALLGAAVGFIPGVAIAKPLTGNGWLGVDVNGEELPDYFLAIPWPMIAGLVVALPLLTALVVGLATRSRLPLVARLD